MGKLTTTYDMLVIGGGFAGITAARELRSAGWTVLVLEARDRLGGRAWFKPNALGEIALEMGGTWIDPRERYAWAEAKRYRLQLSQPVAGAWPSTWLVQGRLHRGALPLPIAEIPDVERLVTAFSGAAGRIDPGRPLAEQNLADLDISLEEYLERLRLGAATRDLAEVFFRAYGSAEARNISALHLIRRIAAAGSLAEFVMSASGYRLREGTGVLVAAIAADADADLRFSTPVQAVRQDATSVAALSAAGVFHGRSAVIAVPLNVLKQIEFEPPLTAPKQRLSTQELACAGIKLWVVVKGAPTDFFANGRAAGLDWLESEGTIVQGGALMVGYGPDADALDIADHKAVQRAVRSFVPEGEVLAIAGHDWRHDPYARETWAVFRPGQLTSDEPSLRMPEGLLSFAGAHTALRWNGFIDGAIESGFRAAQETSARLQSLRLQGSRQEQA
ncbi:MAG: FAD-dependent oxidoreductase [Proteobacteria bacterium]|nr:FAD-dependent oxidoreductase [Pseudomonadota bacterium]